MNDMIRAAMIEPETPPSRWVIGIGELAVSRTPSLTIATHAVGSCIAVCIFDPIAAVAGMLHFLLPESAINPERASRHPAVFADTGIPLLSANTAG